MLFGLTPVDPHGLRSLHNEFETFLVNASTAGRFGTALCSEWFRPVVDASDSLRAHLEATFHAIQALPLPERIELCERFRSSNEIREVCTDLGHVRPETLETLPDQVQDPLVELARYLWKPGKELKTFERAVNTTIRDHYERFRELNQALACPFCGLSDLPNARWRRAAYDHYLPRGKYPLSNVNFDNLMPMCDDCNESPAKGEKDPISDDQGGNRLAFYPYSDEPRVRLRMRLAVDPPIADTRHSGRWLVDLEAENPDKQAMVDTWAELFGIEMRFSLYAEDRVLRWIASRAAGDDLLGDSELDAAALRIRMRAWRGGCVPAVDWPDRSLAAPGTHIEWAVYDFLAEDASEVYLTSIALWLGGATA